MMFGLTGNVAIQPIISTKTKEVCCDSINHYILCIIKCSSDDIRKIDLGFFSLESSNDHLYPLMSFFLSFNTAWLKNFPP